MPELSYIKHDDQYLVQRYGKVIAHIYEQHDTATTRWTYIYNNVCYNELSFELAKQRLEQQIEYEERIKRLEGKIQLAIGFRYVQPSTSKIPLIEIVKRGQRNGISLWAIKNDGSTLSKDNEWEHESIPSSRTEGYLELHRYNSYDEAVAMLDSHFSTYPSGYKR